MSQKSCNNSFENIKSIYILKQVLNSINSKNLLELIKYNKNIQKKLDIGINDYKYFKKIIIEIIPISFKEEEDDDEEEKPADIDDYDFTHQFINIDKENESYYHIYFNDEEEDKTKRYYVYPSDKKIKVIIDSNIKSLDGLFHDCRYNEKINFIIFNRNDIKSMNCMFKNCEHLKELNLNNFNTDNVTNMSGMFHGCYSLKELNLSNFKTNNVTDMSWMFCSCYSLKELDLNNFIINNSTKTDAMFYDCLDDFKQKVKEQNKNLKINI